MLESFQGLQRISLILLMFFLVPQVREAHGGISPSPRDPRLSHARELLGKRFKKTVLRRAKGSVEISDFVTETTRAFLPKKERSKAERISRAIVNASEEYGFDPVFLMAVIQNESSFEIKKRGRAGEIGLMQILPTTAAWIAPLYDLEYQGARTLMDPESNVWIGAALLDRLRHQFDQEGRMYLSAYNIGPRKLRKLVSRNKRPRMYVTAVMKRYLALYEGFKAPGNLETLSRVAHTRVRDLTISPAQN